MPSTLSVVFDEPEFDMKKRMNGYARLMHPVGVVAELPDGRESEYLSLELLTFQGSFPLTSVAPPDSCQPLVLSSAPFGMST
jgi:hypothetical protein